MPIRSLAIIVMLLVGSTAGAVPRNTVKAHIDKATKAHKEGKFDVALEELKAAYALDPKPELLFGIAQVYVKLDNCAEAITYYEKFLATTKDKKAKPVVTQAIDTCKAKPVEPKVEPKVEPTVEPPVEEPKVEPKVEPKAEPEVGPKAAPKREATRDDPFARGRSQPSRSSPWYKDPLGDALVAGGVLAGVGAFVLWRAANKDIDKANATTDDIGRFRELEDSASSKRTFSIVLTGAAGALVTVGIVRYKTRGSKNSKHESARVGLIPTTEGGLVTMNGRF